MNKNVDMFFCYLTIILTILNCAAMTPDCAVIKQFSTSFVPILHIYQSKSAEKKTKETLKEVAMAATINKTRKTYW
jgi:hypothetical protein